MSRIAIALLVWIFSVPLHPAAASEALFSRVRVNGYIDRTGCLRNVDGSTDCIGGSDTDHYDFEQSTATSESAFASGAAPVPTVGGVLSDTSARAKSEPFTNRAEAHASGFAAQSDDIFGNTNLRDGKAHAEALSAWTAPLTFRGGAGSGTATMRFRLTGSLGISGVSEVAGGSVVFGFASLPGLDPDLSVPALTRFSLATTDTSIDETIDVVFPFFSGVAQQAVATLAVSATANAYHPIDFDVPGEGDVIGLPRNGAVHAEFFSTAQVEQLIVPFGVTVEGAGGSALPFAVVAVPEPRTYALSAIGLGLVLLRARARRKGRDAAAH